MTRTTTRDIAQFPMMAGKQTQRRVRRAAEIIAAAREVFLEKGFERATVAEIAAKVGVVEGLVFSYFPTKRDLLNSVLMLMYQPLIRDMEEGYARLRGIRNRLRFLAWRHMRVYVEEPGLARLVLHEVRTGKEYFDSGLHDLHVRYTSYVARALKDAIKEGELPEGISVELIRSVIYGGIEHLMWPILYGRGGVDLDQAADSLTDLLLVGMQGSQPPKDAMAERLARLEAVVSKLVPDNPPVPAEPARRKAKAQRRVAAVKPT